MKKQQHLNGTCQHVDHFNGTLATRSQNLSVPACRDCRFPMNPRNARLWTRDLAPLAILLTLPTRHRKNTGDILVGPFPTMHVRCGFK